MTKYNVQNRLTFTRCTCRMCSRTLPTSPTCPTSSPWGSGTSRSTYSYPYTLPLLRCCHCFWLLNTYCLPITRRPVEIDPTFAIYATLESRLWQTFILSKHKKPFILAPGLARAILSVFLNQLSYELFQRLLAVFDCLPISCRSSKKSSKYGVEALKK